MEPPHQEPPGSGPALPPWEPTPTASPPPPAEPSSGSEWGSGFATSSEPATDAPGRPARPRYGLLVIVGIVGALVAGGAAAALAMQLAKPDIPPEALAPQSPTGPEAPAVAPVGDLTAEQGKWDGDPSSWQITLTWSAPAGEPDHYVVVRDGKALEEVDEASFVDPNVTPQTAYAYEVVAVAPDGAESEPVEVRIKTGKLQAADARVEGRWILRLTVQSSSIGAGGGPMIAFFDPMCDAGPCDVTWRFRNGGNTGEARAAGAKYHGTGTGSFFTLDCHGNRISSTSVTLEFRVIKAHTLGKAWRATKIKGSLTESVPSVSNCLSARNVWTFEGEVQG